MSNTVERLRELAEEHYEMLGDIHVPLTEAADEITRLRSENERLRAALDDVLPLAESYLNIMPDRRGIHIPKLEAARAALSDTQPAPEHRLIAAAREAAEMARNPPPPEKGEV